MHHDVFLSYHWRDHEPVEELARELTERGLTLFLDRWYLAPGKSWAEELERILATCKAVAVCLGPEGMGPWQQREQYLALERQARDPELPVIPVLLPQAVAPLGFLQLNTWVDCRGGVSAARVDVLAAAIRGQALGGGQRAQLEAARAQLCPFRGLLPFREEDAPFFFGRDTYTEKLVAAVAAHAFVAVVGASGSGKSSVARAGLVPALRSGAADECWEVATMVPTDRPLQALARALVPLLEPGLSRIDRLAKTEKVRAHLEHGPDRLRDVVDEVLATQPGTTHLLLLVDQWEELHTLVVDEERGHFIDALLDAAASGPVTVVLTLRGDFYGQVLNHRALADRLQGEAVVSLGPMNREELEQAVTEPAKKVGLQFEGGLVERILDDVEVEPGRLPLLEFVMEQLWEKRQGVTLLNAAYQAMGGVSGAIATRAEAEFGKLTPAQQETARQVLLQLVQPGEETAATRQRALFELGDDARGAVIQRLADARLVVTALDETSGNESVEVAHEALIRHWGRLRAWVDGDREFLRKRVHLQVAARQWVEEDQPADRLMPAGRPLNEAATLLESRRDALGVDVVAYLEASVATARAQRRKRAALIVSLGAVFLVIVGVLLSAWWLDRNALTLALFLQGRLDDLPWLPEMVDIRPGEASFPRNFTMGSSDGATDERPPHPVELKRPFRIGKYEVTFAAYERFAKLTERRVDDTDWGRGNGPAIHVSWEDAVAYAAWLSALTGTRYRLPTESEWEYVARAGSTTAYWWGNEVRQDGRVWANCDGCGSEWDNKKTAPVGQFPVNRFGVHDTAGNVWEWVQDCWHPNYEGAPGDGRAWETDNGGDCSRRVIRGGSWDKGPVPMRSAHRSWYSPGTRHLFIGFRLAQGMN